MAGRTPQELVEWVEHKIEEIAQQGAPQYALANTFSLRNRDNNLCAVLSVLKRLSELISQ